MEIVNNHITNDYPTINPYIGVIGIEELLKEKRYVVVSDLDNPCHGVLTPLDILSHPHKLVIDCISPKEAILTSDSFDIIYRKFKRSKSEALPVYNNEKFLGILEVSQIWGLLNKSMEDYKKDVKKFGELKTSLLHNLYHEIRTPLNHVQGFMGVLSSMDQENLKKNFSQYSHIIEHGSKRFLKFMNNLIDLSTLESEDTFELNTSSILIEDLFKELMTQYDQDYSDNIEADLRYEMPVRNSVVTDYARLKQLLSVLIDISVFLSKGKSTILIGCHDISDQEKLRFFVKNETSNVNEWQSKVILNGVEGFYRHEETEHYGFQMEFIKMMTALLNGTFEMAVEKGNVVAYLTVPYAL
jgi:light-regulated signal transduction histidine kinase (bacteriophytochrome)